MNEQPPKEIFEDISPIKCIRCGNGMGPRANAPATAYDKDGNLVGLFGLVPLNDDGSLSTNGHLVVRAYVCFKCGGVQLFDTMTWRQHRLLREAYQAHAVQEVEKILGPTGDEPSS